MSPNHRMIDRTLLEANAPSVVTRAFPRNPFASSADEMIR